MFVVMVSAYDGRTFYVIREYMVMQILVKMNNCERLVEKT